MRLEGEVRITNVEAFAAAIIVPSLPALAERYPGISIEIDTDTRSVSLSRREADIAVRLAAFEQQEAVVKKAGEMRFGLFASVDYLANRGEPDWSKGAEAHALIALQNTLQQVPEARWLGATASGARTVLRTNSREGQLRAALAGLGLACLPRYLADPHDMLVRLSPPQPAPSRDIWTGVHQDSRRTPRVRAVLDHLGETFKAAARRLAPEESDENRTGTRSRPTNKFHRLDPDPSKPAPSVADPAKLPKSTID